ncbi:MAG: sigma-54-dependent Fis family transcriptional regulator [Bdellovibrionales bacterium]|nr:sigma-54-dependent Fis family transcriptional regulator [Bdellovibrionales bacterium]
MSKSASAKGLRILIQSPSGELERVPVPLAWERFQVGRDAACDVRLRDPRSAPRVLEAWRSPDGRPGLWIRALGELPVELAGLAVREAFWIPGTPVQAGESALTLEEPAAPPVTPPVPTGLRPWRTRTELGENLLRDSARAARSGLPLYLAGETGTGKEVLARLLHAWSDRASGPFIPLHCGALPLGLADSELFGHVRGAYTGADRSRTGALLQAHGGTLFLDEVGDLPPEIQVKLLRFLENGEIRPLGSDRSSHADVRLLCATHLPLELLVQEGRFRRDLFFRLASVTLRLPALRERPDDIDLLANEYAASGARILSPCALRILRDHDWPGNVRELSHAVGRACGLSESREGMLLAADFSFLEEGISGSEPQSAPLSLPLNLREAERALLLRALRRSRGNRAGAARLLGVARSTLFEMLKRHGVQGPRAA